MEVKEPWPPERVWLPTGVVQLAAVSPELENVEGAYWIRLDIADERVREARSQALAVALDYQRMGINEFYAKYGTAMMSNALEVAQARAAEAKGE